MRTIKDPLEAAGFKFIAVLDCEFIVYAKEIPNEEGARDLASLDEAIHMLERCHYHDYERIACGRALYVFGNHTEEL
jgi:hypothetical protein